MKTVITQSTEASIAGSFRNEKQSVLLTAIRQQLHDGSEDIKLLCGEGINLRHNSHESERMRAADRLRSLARSLREMATDMDQWIEEIDG